MGSPVYLASHARPKSPRDLVRHRCINFRHGDSGIYRWEFEKGRKSLSVAVSGPLIADDLELVIRAAIDDDGWCQPFPGYFLYYPSRRQQHAALAVLIEFLRM